MEAINRLREERHKEEQLI